MSAKPKPEHDLPREDQTASDTEDGKVRGPVVPGPETEAENAASPARELQERLEETLKSEEPRQGSIMDIGRVLAVSSGITMILGVFIISGIW